ncbi:hypothetical protein [Williamsoniiplasma lucivorax]|uniref:Uncharacterized protein n=1 Tax=Williamsoniiplasma lucivorax TaxID=209274 RepID=A0A2S5RFN6_9MOLU|nr:hypothetical protein [Williamsoniiplasma lucivorax]PPE06108.1 hypothetical protein ELUCI_v1c03990 [Williamsoniiplasma lucivorax]
MTKKNAQFFIEKKDNLFQIKDENNNILSIYKDYSLAETEFKKLLEGEISEAELRTKTNDQSTKTSDESQISTTLLNDKINDLNLNLNKLFTDLLSEIKETKAVEPPLKNVEAEQQKDQEIETLKLEINALKEQLKGMNENQKTIDQSLKTMVEAHKGMKHAPVPLEEMQKLLVELLKMKSEMEKNSKSIKEFNVKTQDFITNESLKKNKEAILKELLQKLDKRYLTIDKFDLLSQTYFAKKDEKKHVNHPEQIDGAEQKIVEQLMPEGLDQSDLEIYKEVFAELREDGTLSNFLEKLK